MFAKIIPSCLSSSRRARAWLALAGLASLGAGAGCSASADLPEVAVTRSDIAFEGMPEIPGHSDTTQTLETSFDHPSDMELPKDLKPELRARSVTVTARGGMVDLSFLEGVEITLSSRAPGAPEPDVLAYYERPRSGQVGRVIEMQTNKDSDVIEYWDTKQAYYDVKVWGILPPEDWSVDVTFSFSGSISVSAP